MQEPATNDGAFEGLNFNNHMLFTVLCPIRMLLSSRDSPFEALMNSSNGVQLTTRMLFDVVSTATTKTKSLVCIGRRSTPHCLAGRATRLPQASQASLV
jgi:hypothetical protein